MRCLKQALLSRQTNTPKRGFADRAARSGSTMPTVRFRVFGGQIKPEFQLPASATILELKYSIQTRLDVEVNRQTLCFNHQELMDNHLIESYGLEHITVVNLAVTPLPGQPKFSILVKSPCKEEAMKVRETTLVFDLKLKIQKRWGVPARCFTLVRLCKEMVDAFPLHAYYICEGSLVEVKSSLEPLVL